MIATMKRAFATLLTLALTVPIPASAGPDADADAPPAPTTDPTTADDWLRVALSRYEAEDWKGAIDAFRRGHELDPRPQFLFAIAQAERRRGDCAAAVRAYDQFLATSPPEAQAAAARDQRDRCEEALRPPEPEPEPQPAGPPPPPPAPTTIIVTTPDEPSWWRDPVTAGAAGGAVVLGLLGAALLVAADATAEDAGAAPDLDTYLDLKGRAEVRHTAALVTLGVGAAVGGYTIYRIVRGSSRQERRTVEVRPGPGVGVALGGRF